MLSKLQQSLACLINDEGIVVVDVKNKEINVSLLLFLWSNNVK